MTWEQVALADIADIQGGIQKQPKRAPRQNAFPFLRVANVTSHGLDLTDVHEVELFGNELERLRLQRGDLLVVEGNGSPSQIGRAAVWDGSVEDCVHQNHLIRVRPHAGLDSTYLGLVWNSPPVRDELTAVSSSTSGLHTLSVAKLKRIVLPVPSLREQARVVEILGDHLSHLDAAQQSLEVAEARRVAWGKAVLQRWVWEESFELTTVADVLREPMRNGRSDRTSDDPSAVRTLTLTAVTKGDFGDHHTKLTSTPREVAAGLWLEPGDVFVQRSNTPELVGSSARYDGSREWAIFPDLLIRVRPDESRMDSRFLVAALRTERAHRSLRARAKGLAGSMPKIDQRTVGQTVVPIPSRDRQLEIVGRLDELHEAGERMRTSVASAARRGEALRRATLAAAFEGKLTGRHTDAEVIEELAFA